MFKRIIAIVLCLLLVLSFAACKKDKNGDVWEEELEDLWNDLKENGNVEISGSSSSTDSSSQESSSAESSSSGSNSTPSNTTDSNEDETDNLAGEVVVGDDGIIW